MKDRIPVFVLPGGWDTEEEAMRSVGCCVKSKIRAEDGSNKFFGKITHYDEDKDLVKVEINSTVYPILWTDTIQAFKDYWDCD